MLTETASVVGLDKNTVLLQTRRKATCSGCSMKSGCGQYLLAREDAVLSLPFGGDIAADECLQVLPGDELTLGLEASQLLILTAWFYVFPLAMLLLATMIATLLGLSEQNTVLGAFAGLAFGILVTRCMLRSEKLRKRTRPQLYKQASTGDPVQQGSGERHEIKI